MVMILQVPSHLGLSKIQWHLFELSLRLCPAWDFLFKAMVWRQWFCGFSKSDSKIDVLKKVEKVPKLPQMKIWKINSPFERHNSWSSTSFSNQLNRQGGIWLLPRHRPWSERVAFGERGGGLVICRTFQCLKGIHAGRWMFRTQVAKRSWVRPIPTCFVWIWTCLLIWW